MKNWVSMIVCKEWGCHRVLVDAYDALLKNNLFSMENINVSLTNDSHLKILIYKLSLLVTNSIIPLLFILTIFIELKNKDIKQIKSFYWMSFNNNP
jgi:hypothetical protein